MISYKKMLLICYKEFCSGRRSYNLNVSNDMLSLTFVFGLYFKSVHCTVSNSSNSISLILYCQSLYLITCMQEITILKIKHSVTILITTYLIHFLKIFDLKVSLFIDFYSLFSKDIYNSIIMYINLEFYFYCSQIMMMSSTFGSCFC